MFYSTPDLTLLIFGVVITALVITLGFVLRQ
jgi:hypothetical protein